MNEFKPGLEGVVAVETEIAEPDREGGVLRYRGIDISELVGHHPYENVWGLLVDNDLDVTMPEPEPYEPVGLTGNAPADLQAETARLAGRWQLGKLNEISDEQAREDLGRLSAQMMGIVARSARIADGKTDVVPADVVAQGQTAAEKFLLQWRGEADPKAVRAIDTYWICTAEHGLNASTFTARVVASTGADCGAALSSAVGALSGPLHGGAPAYVKPMLDEVAAMGDPEKWVKDTLDSGKRVMGFGHRIYRAEDPRSQDPQGNRPGARLAPDRGCGAPRSGRPRRARAASSRAAAARRTSSTTPRSSSTSRRSRRRSRPPCSRALGSRAGRPTSSSRSGRDASSGRMPGTSALLRERSPGVTLAEAAAQAAELAEAGKERELSELRRQWEDELEGAARSADFRERAIAYRAIGQFRWRQKTELLRRGLGDDSPACRGSALVSIELLSRDHPGLVNDSRVLLVNLLNSDGNTAVRRLAAVCLCPRLAAARDDRAAGAPRRRRRAARRPARGRAEGGADAEAEGARRQLGGSGDPPLVQRAATGTDCGLPGPPSWRSRSGRARADGRSRGRRAGGARPAGFSTRRRTSSGRRRRLRVRRGPQDVDQSVPSLRVVAARLDRETSRRRAWGCAAKYASRRRRSLTCV